MFIVSNICCVILVSSFFFLQGLFEVHRSSVAVHGDLNSSNCLIDNRWVCKLSNFGTNKFKSDVRKQPNNTHDLCKSKCFLVE